MYSDFSFYKDTYNGVLTEAEYTRYGVRATAEIDCITSQRSKTATGDDLELLKFAECAVIDELGKQADGGIITAESNDGISRSYAAETVKTSQQRIFAAAFTWLHGSNLLYCGI